jgi:hypothetical protein
MNRKSSFVITMILLAFVLVACGQPATQEIAPTQTATQIPPTQTPTLVPSPVPTHTPTPTPTIAPTPLGGRNGLLFQDWECIQDSTTKEYMCNTRIYIYDLVLQKPKLLFEGNDYRLVGVSPDGKKFVMEQTKNNKTCNSHKNSGVTATSARCVWRTHLAKGQGWGGLDVACG